MAIQASIITIQGVLLPTAHINLANPQILKTRTATVAPATSTTPESTTYTNLYSLSVSANVYVSEALYNAGNIPVECFSISCPVDITQNVLTQGYVALNANSRLSNILQVV